MKLLLNCVLPEVPLGAKRAHLDALRAACAQVLQGTPCNTASPLPPGGLAPAIARLLAREELDYIYINVF